MNHHLFRVGLLLLLVALVAVPAPALTECPSTCSCLLPAKAEALGYPEYCSGKQMVCGYDLLKNQKFCYTIPVDCPSTCACFTLEDGKARGYPRCGDTLILCGAGEDLHPMYCHQLPVTEETVSCPLSCTCQQTKPYLEAGYEYCGGNQTVCGEDEVGNPLSCFEIPVTPAPVQVPQKCSPSCSCYTLAEGSRLGYTLCGGTQTLCGYSGKTSMFCHQPRSGARSLPVAAQETPASCSETYVGSGSLKTGSDGSLNCSVLITASDRKGALLLQQGTQVLDATDHPVTTMSIARAVSTGLPADLSDDQYRYEGYAYRCLPEGAHFNSPTMITISPGGDEWNAVEGKDLVIRGYDAGTSRWEDRPTTIRTEEKTISAPLEHFSTIALFSRTNTSSPGERTATGSANDPWKGTPLFAAIPAEYAPLAALVVGMIAIIGGALASEPGPRTRKITGTVESSLKAETAGMMGRVEAEKRKIGPRTSASEASMLSSRELAVVAGSAVIFAVAFVLRNKIAVDWGTLLIFLLMGGVATIAHELGHRLVGRRYGYPSELQFWALGSGTMLLTAWIFGTAFAQPSRTVMKGAANASDVHDVMVRVAGPLVNLLFAALSFLLLPLGGYFTVMGTAGFSMNLLTSVVSLMPVKPMDGEQVFRWNRFAWGLIWVPVFAVYCLFFIF